jgi:hypothetical protein
MFLNEISPILGLSTRPWVSGHIALDLLSSGEPIPAHLLALDDSVAEQVQDLIPRTPRYLGGLLGGDDFFS